MRKCKICKKEFAAYNSMSAYCSFECSEKNRKKLSKRYYSEKRKNRLHAEKEWATAVKDRAGWKCEYCGTTDNLNAHHIFSRNNKSVKFDLDNGVCICAMHHVFDPRFSAHKAPAEFIEWIKEYRGLEWYERLRKKAKTLLQDLGEEEE